ncbi:uncharacterized protein K444DRAFT_232276 [Hyaloscypha bicolor E]|uniref:Uncharacterized protein n=1 Tax=Hyaloscypha bicolor E TaxID=1095630 RepID=A0A2J6SL18_9HELO|nr:uncharacterized protein K444DRAFT_232276 [Hyaloscypha bicolor E]PMD51447.1 hypothetical protein K444DRAFT_232276 [Hyaloscypha bicolor E]
MSFAAKSTRPRDGKKETSVRSSADNSSTNAPSQPKRGVADQPATAPNTLNPSKPSLSKYFYDLPARLNDLEGRDATRAGWSSTIDSVMNEIIRSRKEQSLDIKSYNPAHETSSNAAVEIIKWLAYPNNCKLRREENKNRYVEADVRANQDEYCEWEVERQNGHLKSVTFTTEVPEYYTYLAKADPTGALLLRQYKRLNPDVADSIKLEDLVDARGAYNIKNRWNTRGTDENLGLEGRIAHLIRENNNLQEAAELVVDSTVVRRDAKGEFVAGGRSLLLAMVPKVSDNSPNRNSDPNIAAFINQFSRDGKLVTVSNPVGLYIDSFEDSDFKTVDGDSVSSFWNVERKSQDGRYVVRAKFTVPTGLLGKILHAHTKQRLKHGSQLAESIWIAAYVTIADSTIHSETPCPAAASHPIYSFIEGRQIKPTEVPRATINNELRLELFGAYLASTEKPAIILRDLIATFEDYTWAAFAADEGIGFYSEVVRVRMVLIWIPGSSAKPRSGNTSSKMGDAQLLKRDAFVRPTVMVVALPPFDNKTNIHSENSILQVASYDPRLGWFNFYDKTGDRRWLYFGNSNDAFAPDTHGLGPFCGHPNGALAMKEIVEPWPHWHSTRAQLDLKHDHPLSRDPLFRDPNTGSWYFRFVDQLAHMVTAGTKKMALIGFKNDVFLTLGHGQILLRQQSAFTSGSHMLA